MDVLRRAMRTKMADNFGYLPHYIRFLPLQIVGLRHDFRNHQEGQQGTTNSALSVTIQDMQSGELAARAGVNVETLRFYERKATWIRCALSSSASTSASRYGR